MTKLRMTASEAELRWLLKFHPKADEAMRLLEEIKRQMYFDGAEAMLRSYEGRRARVDRTGHPSDGLAEAERKAEARADKKRGTDE